MSADAMALPQLRMFSGDRIFLVFELVDLDADPTGATPYDLSTRVAKWSLARVSNGTYSKTPKVDKSSATSSEVSASVSTVGSATPYAGGSGYVVGDVLVLSGGVGSPGLLKVESVGGSGDALSFSVVQGGSYISSPSSPVLAGIGSGTGCSVTLTMVELHGAVVVEVVAADTEALLGEFHQELEIFDQDGQHKVVAVGDVVIRRNIKNT